MPAWAAFYRSDRGGYVVVRSAQHVAACALLADVVDRQPGDEQRASVRPRFAVRTVRHGPVDTWASAAHISLC
jgi:hypothetical protein